MRAESLLTLLCLGCLCLPAGALEATGSARSVDGGELLYREFHRCEPGGVHCRVEYRGADEHLFAFKQLDYSRAPWAPSVHFEDSRHDEQQTIEADKVDAGVVIDAGFDNFVREQWPALVAGETVVFEFQPVALDRPIAMRATVEENCERERLCIRVQPNNWLLGLVVQEIDLVYSRAGQRLLEFRGVSNIADSEGRSQAVEIRYEYAAVPGASEVEDTP